MDIDLFRGLMTALLFVLFVGLWVRSWNPKRKPEFDAAAQLPLEDDQRPPATEDEMEQRS